MQIEKLLYALMIISVLTNLSTEAVKTVFDEVGKKYSSNVVAAVMSIVCSVLVSAIYMIIESVPFTLSVVVIIFCISWLSFLIATLGYDKVMQSLKQIGKER